MSNTAIILSAGTGSRFSNELPKQFLKIKNKTILEWCVSIFEQSKLIDNFIVVSHQSYVEQTKSIIKNFKKLSGVLCGGKRRQDSVFNGLKFIKDKKTSCDFVFIHDVARPFLSQNLLEQLFDVAQKKQACIPVLALADTVKAVQNSKVINTPDRRQLARVQTPQVFNFSVFYDLYTKFPQNNDITDDAGIFEYFNKDVYTIPGEQNNIKITYPFDIIVAEAIINEENI